MQGVLEKTESRESIVIENNGLQLFGILHRPLNVYNPPVVLIMHGFASSKHGSNRCYVTLAEAMVKEGIAVLRFDFRGCGDSEGSLNDSSLNDLISDALAVLGHISKIEGIDGERIAIFGASLGGSIAVEASALWSGIKALALWSPVASGELWFRDFLTKHPEYKNAPPTSALALYRGVKLTPQFREQFAKLFAYKTAATMPTLPILHMQGERDETISMAHQEAFKAANPKATCIRYPEEQHSLGFAKVFPEVIAETIAFFKRYI